MPHKKFFNKENSVKFLLLHGNTQAVNADGETLENILVPVSKNYKPGTSLLMSNIAALCDSEPLDELNKEPDLEKIMGELEDAESVSEIIAEDLPSQMKKLNFLESPKQHKSPNHCDKDEDNDFNYDFFDGQFSDASGGTCEEEDSEDDAVEPNCPATLKMFNEKFKQVFKEYNEDQIGSLDDEDICGYASVSSKRFSNLMDAETNREEELVLGNYDEDIKEKILNYAEDSGDEKIVEIVIEKPLEFDCESILSTYSNKYNHPTVIKEEKVKKIQIPNNPLRKKLTKSYLKTLDKEKESDNESDDNISVNTEFNIRVKGETPEQRRERKNLFKEAKRESRMMKKENKLAFKKIKKLQTSQHINAQRNAGIKLL